MTFVETTPVIIPPIEQLEEMKNITKPHKKRQPKHDFGDGFGRINAHKHDNGNGWIADTARVEDTVYVGRRCQIYDNAIVRGQVRLEGTSKISGHAVVSGRVTLTKQAHIFGTAIVRDTTSLSDNVKVFGAANVAGSSCLAGDVKIFDSAQIVSTSAGDKTEISGRAFVLNSDLHGTIEIKGNCCVVKSQINGWARINGQANMLASTIHNHRQNEFVLLTDRAVVGNESAIYMPIEIKDSAVVLKTNIMNDYNASYTAENIFTLNGSMVLQRQSFRSLNDMRRFVEMLTQNGGRTGAAQFTSNGQIANFPVRRVEMSPPGPRRVMRLQEVHS